MEETVDLATKILSVSKGIRRIPFSEFPRIPIALETAQPLLLKLDEEGLLKLTDDAIEVGREQRVNLALYALAAHSDPERVAKLLGWDEFEELAYAIFKGNDYRVARNRRLKHGAKRFQIDLVAVKDPLVLCVDCKHWRYGYSPSRARAAALGQVARAEAVADMLSHLTLDASTAARSLYVLPVILTLMDVPFRFIDRVPIVPIYRLKSFLDDLPPIPDSRFKYFIRKGVQGDCIDRLTKGSP